MKRLILLTLLSLFVMAGNAFAQETINLTVPIARASITSYMPVSLSLTISPSPHITVQIRGTDGVVQTFDYPCDSPCVNSTPASVTTLINQLNNANLTTRSMFRRIFDRLLLDFPQRFVGGATVP